VVEPVPTGKPGRVPSLQGPAARGSDTAPAARGSDTAPAAKGSDTAPAARGSDTAPAAKGSDTAPAASQTAAKASQEPAEPASPAPAKPADAHPHSAETAALSPAAEGSKTGDPGKADPKSPPTAALPLDLKPGDFNLVNIKLSSQVDRKTRQPTKVSDKFHLPEKTVYCWLVFSNKSDIVVPVDMVWKREGVQKTAIRLDIGKKASHWRTWSHIVLGEKSLGAWTVEVIGPAGEVLASRAFSVEP